MLDYNEEIFAANRQIRELKDGLRKDMTMCVGTGCPLRETCYRYTAVPTMMQSFCDFTVGVIHEVEAGFKCLDWVPHESSLERGNEMQIWNGSTTPPNELIGEDSHAYEVGQRIENYTDYLMAECITMKGAEIVYKAGDLENAMPEIMFVIANWTGSTESAASQMRKLHNLLSNEFQKIAERAAE